MVCIKRIIPLAACAALLCGCGGEIGKAKPVKVTAQQSSSVAETTTTAATTTAVTSSAQTTTTGKKTEKKAPEIELEYTNEFEVYEDVRLSDMVKKTDAELLEPDTRIDTETTGKHTVKAKLIADGTEVEKELTYTVNDTTAPVLLGGDYFSTQVGNDCDISSLGFVADNYDTEPTITVDGYVDTDTTGIYSVTATLTDSSGNTSVREMTVEVADFASSYLVPDNGEMTFADYLDRYQGGSADVGIDVSAWQGNIDFDAVASEGCNFVMVRAGYSSGSVTVDDYFLQNVDNAQAAGLDCGVYFYSADSDPEVVRQHAKWLVNALGGRQLSMPIAFDWEDFANFRSYKMNLHTLNQMYKVFKEELESAGYRAMLYGSKNFLSSAWEIEGEDIWLAHYVDQTDYPGSFSLWQTGVGTISGIDGQVDLDVRYSH
ncbi:MAG: glycoside hydrolase family 25 [Ruminococcus sp.]|nr:glycoside hydrolase family 25 [Ruminococcus sp.]